MKIYEMIIDDETHGVSMISLVENPAIEETWVALSKELKLQAVDEEKRMLYGAALVPDRPVYRRDAGEEYYITFSRETIEKAAYKFMREMRLMNTNHEHAVPLEQNVVVESWITMGENDKATALGLNPPAGTWMLGMYVGSDKYWNEQVKTGNVKGFSIEGIFIDKKQKTDIVDEFLSELKAVLNK